MTIGRFRMDAELAPYLSGDIYIYSMTIDRPIVRLPLRAPGRLKVSQGRRDLGRDGDRPTPRSVVRPGEPAEHVVDARRGRDDRGQAGAEADLGQDGIEGHRATRLIGRGHPIPGGTPPASPTYLTKLKPAG